MEEEKSVRKCERLLDDGVEIRVILYGYYGGGGGEGGLHHFSRNLHFFFVPVITFFPFLLCK